MAELLSDQGLLFLGVLLVVDIALGLCGPLFDEISGYQPLVGQEPGIRIVARLDSVVV